MGDNIYFFKMFRYMKPYMFAFCVGMFFYASQGFMLPFMISFFSSNIMAAIINNSISGIYMSVVYLMLLIFGILLVLMPGIYAQIMSEAKAVRDLKKHLFRVFVRNSLENASAGHSGEGIAAINTDANTATDVYGWPLTAFLMNVINIVFASIVVFVVDWRLGFAALGLGILGFFFQHRFTAPLARLNKERLEVNAELVKSTSNIFSGALTIRAYNMQSRAVLTFDKDNQRLKYLGLKNALISMWQSTFNTLQGWLSIVIVFALGGWLVATGRLEFHLLIMVPLMFRTITESIADIGRTYANLQGPIAGAKRVFNILDTEASLPCEKKGETRFANGYTLKLKNMDFAYLSAEEKTLENINLEIKENEMVALVGESGSGKSTLLRAIIGLYERENLGLSIGDLCFNDSSTKGWRQHFAYVDQTCKLFDMSIKENILMGKLSGSDEDVIAASKRAAAHDFINDFDEKYDSSCGEKGGTLSGGQKQRIAIARALIKKAPILVFDEATSALDAGSERYIMETIESLRNDHTILITTHHLKNIVTADKIVVMDKGCIAEMGTHDELLSKKRIYFKLFNEEN